MAAPEKPTLSYPCRFPIKAFLKPEGGAELRVRKAVLGAIGAQVEVRRQLSSHGSYICLTFDFVAINPEHVSRVRAVLRADPAVLMSL